MYFFKNGKYECKDAYNKGQFPSDYQIANNKCGPQNWNQCLYEDIGFTVSFDTTKWALSDGEKTITSVGDIQGYVAEAPRGENGFGFDEIFELEDGRTLAEILTEEKNQISARKKALENLKEKLKKLII